MRMIGPVLTLLLLLLGSAAFGQSSVGALGKASDAAQRVFEHQVGPTSSPVTQPAYPGGMARMYEFIQKNLAYPPSEAAANVQGKVYVEFLVGADGTLDQVLIRSGLSPAIDEEAKRVVRLMPKWIPAQMDGHPVRAKMTIPVEFKLH